jgi:hypothetical protein
MAELPVRRDELRRGGIHFHRGGDSRQAQLEIHLPLLAHVPG